MHSQIEPELQQDAPRPTRITPYGARRLLLSTLPLAAAVALTRLFAGPQTQPAWLESVFVGLLLASIAILYAATDRPLAQLRLAERGVPALGTIAAKEPWFAGFAHYYCWYEAAGEMRGLEWAGGKDEAQVGDTVTVLYAADDPNEAVAYRWAACKAFPAGCPAESARGVASAAGFAASRPRNQ